MLIVSLLASLHPAPCAAAYAAGAKAARHTPAPPPIHIGEINTYRALPAFAVPYRRGWMLALEQVNATGGVQGRKLEVLSRDDGGKPDDAVRAARELTGRGVVALFGGYSTEVALALSRYADDSRTLYLAVAPLSQRLTWQDGNAYTFRLRPGAWMQAAAVAPKALALRKHRWVLVYADTESDRATVEAFKDLMHAFQSSADFVLDLAIPAQGGDAGAAVAALPAARPDAIFNVLTGPALAEFVRAGVAAHAFDDRAVVSLFTGEPENLGQLDASVPDGWIITGYPRDAVGTAQNKAFVQAYLARYGDYPVAASVLGYTALNSIAQGLIQSDVQGSTLAAAFAGMKVETPFGQISYRALDHQSTLGTYVGYTGHDPRGKPVMTRFAYASGVRLQPLDQQVRKLRRQDDSAIDTAAGRSGAASTRPPGRADAAGTAQHETTAHIGPGAHSKRGTVPGTPARSSRQTSAAGPPASAPDTALNARLSAPPSTQDASPGAAGAGTVKETEARPAPAAAASGVRPVAAGMPAAAPWRTEQPLSRMQTSALPAWPDISVLH